MSINVKLSQARSGGASEGRGYFKELVEIDRDGVFFTCKYFAMASAGVVYHVPMLCGFSVEEFKDMLISIGGDKYQRMDPTKGKNPFAYMRWAFGVKHKFYKEAEELAKKNFTWEKMRASGRIGKFTKPFITIAKFSDVLKVLKKDLLEDVLNGRIENPLEIISDGAPGSLANLITTYYFSDDGVYKWYPPLERVVKVTDEVTPLWKCYMMAFANLRPFGKIYRLDFGGKNEERPFDGGVVTNFANLFLDKYQLISCIKVPTKEALEVNKGVASLSAYNYLLQPAEKVGKAYPSDGRNLHGFYDVSDEVIQKEYDFAVKNWQTGKYFS